MGNYFSQPPLPTSIRPLHLQPYPSNQVTTTKYTLLSFIPLALILQFNRLANIYFLITAIIQSIPIISPLPWYSAVLPLALVLTVSLLREASEEYYKYKCDKESNSSIHMCWDEEINDWKQVIARDIKLGMVLKIKDNQICPCDLLVLKTYKPQGIMYLETSSLDGEKALKPKNSLKFTQNSSLSDLKPLTIKVSPPESSLYKFQALINNGEKQKYANIKNFVYRGSRPKNSVWMVGLVVYVGENTKIMLNCGESENKMSMIERKVNVLMVFVFLVQLALMCIIAGLRTYWLLNKTNMIIDYHITPTLAEIFLSFSNYFILLNTMIPISLIVSIEIVKTIQGYFITHDHFMQVTNPVNKDQPPITAKAFRCSLNQELGMVEYIFTDKTGTLTKNQMVMKSLVIGTQHYQSQSKSKKYISSKLEKDMESTHPFQRPIQLSPKAKITNQMEIIEMFLFVVSICHECVLNSECSIDDPVYEGSSPDEIALVNTMKDLGWVFEGINLDQINLKIPTGNRIKPLQILHIFEFDSNRKRMSVMIRCHYGIILCTKGADNIIKKLLKPDQFNLDIVNNYIQEFSVKGLRTLLVCCRYVKEEEYSAFEMKIQGLMEKDKEKKEQYINELEQNMILLGATGVEDKLQDSVPETIRDLLLANIKICMLTGDKLQTAQNIAKSCNLITPFTEVTTIREQSAMVDLPAAYRRAGRWKYDDKKVTIIIEGGALNTILSHEMFKGLMEIADSMVCCRVTPKEKAAVVKVAKEKLKKLVLAIGDGANDVEMINEANIGIGLYGNEGMNAVQASDYALPEFKGLWRLLFVHGRWNYLRITGMIKYFFFKNMVFTFPQFIYAFYCGYSGTTIYNGVYLTLYNSVFTAVPLIVRALFEQDLNYIKLVDEPDELPSQSPRTNRSNDLEQDLMPGVVVNANIKSMMPNLYIIGQSNLLFTVQQFVSINVQATICAVLIFFISSAAEQSTPFTEYSITIYTAVIFLVTFKLCVDVKYWTWLLLIAILFTSIIPYLSFVYVSSEITSFATNGSFQEVFTSYNFYLVVLITSVVSIMFSIVVDISRVYFFPTELDKVRNELKERNRRQSIHMATGERGREGDRDRERDLERELQMVSIQSTKPSQMSYR